MEHSFGGSHLNHKRKSKRPLDFKKATHLVLRLKDQLPKLFDPRDQGIRQEFDRLAFKYQVRLYDLVLNHSHAHSSILIPNREAYVGFIRELTANLVRYWSQKIGIRLRKVFQQRPFSRIVAWGRSYQILKQYLQKNESESGVLQLVRIPSRRTSQQSLFQ
jgi:hypothetical protein